MGMKKYGRCEWFVRTNDGISWCVKLVPKDKPIKTERKDCASCKAYKEMNMPIIEFENRVLNELDDIKKMISNIKS